MIIQFFLLLFSFFYQEIHSLTTPLVNPSNPNFLTGIYALVTSSASPLTTGIQNYQFPLANVLPNNSVNAALGIIGNEMSLIAPDIDFDIYIISVSNYTMYIRTTMASTTNSINKLKICYLVSSYFSLKINYYTHNFLATDQVRDSTNNSFRNCPTKITSSTFIYCRKTPITLSYTSLGNTIKAMAVISGFLVNSFQNVMDPANLQTFGVGVINQVATATGLNVDVYMYGRGYLNSMSFYYISYEQQSLNIFGDKVIITDVMTVGCAIDWWSVCNGGGGSNINISMSTQNTNFGVFYDTNYFYGFSNYMSGFDGTANYGMKFTVGAPVLSGTAYKSSFSYYGNGDGEFGMSFRYLILLDFYCPSSGTADIYYIYGANGCNSTCNGWIGQYADVDRKCQLCGPLCYKCSGTANMCDDCYTASQHRILSGDSCVCNVIGYFDDGTSMVCPSCHYSCQSCWGPSASQCYSCSNTSHRTININTCYCDQRFYDNGSNQICVSCHYTCLTCSGTSATTCLTCAATDFRQPIASNNSCGCMAGYYDKGTPNNVCGTCHYTCLTCSGGSASNKCTSCDLNFEFRTLTSGSCPCLAGYYDNVNPVCALCHVTCKTCDGPTLNDCLSCDNAKFRALQSGQCKCMAKYYEYNLTCQPCHYTCYNCTGGTMYECVNCNNALTFRNFNGTDSSCYCIAGYTEPPTPVALCTKCDRTCLTCSGTSTFCITCDPLKNRQLAGSNCPCIFGYVDTMLLSGLCLKCHYSCLTCSGTLPTQCLTCDTTWRTLNTSGACPCNTHTYDDGIHSQCYPCHQECVECTAQYETSCTACEPLYLRQLLGTAPKPCTCIQRYFENNNALLCDACHFSCLKCSVISTNCTACDSLTDHRVASGTNCLCQEHYYEINAQSCAQCVSTCRNCSVIPNNCTSCYSDRYLSGNTCLCNLGTFQDPNDPLFTCLPCYYSCKTCQNTSSTCLSCPLFSYRTLNNAACPCNFGYYQNNVPICAKCPYQCDGCTGPAPAQCIACPASSMRTLQPDKSCPCDPGYYDDGSSPICKLCKNTCATCTAFSVCTSCFPVTSQFRTLASGSCKCITGYYDNPANPICQTCHYSCATCSGPLDTNCYICKVNRAFQVGSNTCPCAPGYYEAAQICYACDPTCKTCFATATNCTGCDLLTRYLFNNKCYCREGYFENGGVCTACDSTCGSCILSSTNCLSCNPVHFTILNGSSCVCLAGQYKDPSTLVCTACNPKCETCFGAGETSCITCKPLSFRTFNSLNNTCECNPGYIETGAAVCNQCHSSCLTCYGVTDTSCLSCYAGAVKIGSTCKIPITCATGYYFEGYCVTNCPNSTFPLSNICQNCINNCKTCLSATVCTTCVDGYYFNSTAQTCNINCPQGSYINHLNRNCQFCPIGCEICAQRNSSVVCPKCLTGFYLFNHTTCVDTVFCESPNYVIVGIQCFACEHPCQTCNSIAFNGCLSCIDGFSLYNGQCLSVCPLGFYSFNKICLVCQQRCKQCSSTKCQLCKQGFYLTPQEINPKCITNGYYFNPESNSQEKCHLNCKSCTNSSFSSCISCAKFRGNEAEMAISGYCDCWEDSVDIGNGECSFKEYQSVQAYTKVLKSSTDSALYAGTIASVFSGNFISSVMFMLYQQSYSTLYFINASAFLQTDKYLEQALDKNPNFYLNNKLSSKDSSLIKYSRLLVTLQNDMSLFSRGDQFEIYLFNWAIYTVVVIVSMWLFVLLNNFALTWKCVKETQSLKIVLVTAKMLLQQSAIIIVHLLTISQVSLYATVSFKYIIANMDSIEIDWTKFTLSAILAAYYLIYIFRLIKGCCQIGKQQTSSSKQEYNPLRLLAFSFENQQEPTNQSKNKSNKDRFGQIPLLKKLFIPFLMIRMVLSNILIIYFSSSPVIQVGSVLGVIALWTLYSLVFCPYPKFFKIFIHINEIVYIAQIGMFMYSVLIPEGSQLAPSYIQLVLNGIQIASMIGFSLMLVIRMIYGICQETKTQSPNKVGNAYLGQNNISEMYMDLKKDTEFNQDLNDCEFSQADVLNFDQESEKPQMSLDQKKQNKISYQYDDQLYQQFEESLNVIHDEPQVEILNTLQPKEQENKSIHISFVENRKKQNLTIQSVESLPIEQKDSEKNQTTVKNEMDFEEENVVIKKKYRAVRKTKQ